MGNDGASSIYEAASKRGGNKSVMKSEFTSERGGGRPDESNLDASSINDASQYRQSVSGFRQDNSA